LLLVASTLSSLMIASKGFQGFGAGVVVTGAHGLKGAGVGGGVATGVVVLVVSGVVDAGVEVGNGVVV